MSSRLVVIASGSNLEGVYKRNGGQARTWWKADNHIENDTNQTAQD